MYETDVGGNKSCLLGKSRHFISNKEKIFLSKYPLLNPLHGSLKNIYFLGSDILYTTKKQILTPTHWPTSCKGRGWWKVVFLVDLDISNKTGHNSFFVWAPISNFFLTLKDNNPWCAIYTLQWNMNNSVLRLHTWYASYDFRVSIQ